MFGTRSADVDPVGRFLAGALGVGHGVLAAEQCLGELLEAADEPRGCDDFLPRPAGLLRPFPQDLAQVEVFTEQRRRPLHRDRRPQCRAGHGHDVQRRAALAQLFEDVVCGKCAVLLAADGEGHDDGAPRPSGFEVARGFGDAFEQLPAIRGLGPGVQCRDRFAQLTPVGGVVHELLRLPVHLADREFGVPLQTLDELADTVAKNAGTVVVDNQRDLERRRRRLHVHDLALLAADFDDEVGGTEVRHRATDFVGNRHVDGSGRGLDLRGDGSGTARRREGEKDQRQGAHPRHGPTPSRLPRSARCS